MSDKRQRARVQGSWAKQPPKHSGPTGAVPNSQPPNNVNPEPSSWGSGPQKTPKTFEFNQPTKVDATANVLVRCAFYLFIIFREMSECFCLSICSRLRLLPGFLSPEEADWMFSKLLNRPFSQLALVHLVCYSAIAP
uniref:AlkB homolog 3, alpha-ketoglutarate dependent dioxygenase n=1 Tax=Cyclopterus lumpus TaxID=8103 RepID=A0A8C3ANW2_CYCLU